MPVAYALRLPNQLLISRKALCSQYIFNMWKEYFAEGSNFNANDYYSKNVLFLNFAVKLTNFIKFQK